MKSFFALGFILSLSVPVGASSLQLDDSEIYRSKLAKSLPSLEQKSEEFQKEFDAFSNGLNPKQSKLSQSELEKMNAEASRLNQKLDTLQTDLREVRKELDRSYSEGPRFQKLQKRVAAVQTKIEESSQKINLIGHKLETQKYLEASKNQIENDLNHPPPASAPSLLDRMKDKMSALLDQLGMKNLQKYLASSSGDDQAVTLTKKKMELLKILLKQHKALNENYPKALSELFDQETIGIVKNTFNPTQDSWNKEILYQNGETGPILTSAGKDGNFNTADDIVIRIE